MIVTVMSDASFCPKTKAAGWGVWIKSKRGCFQGGGNFKTDADTSTDAEAMAISVAVWIAFRQGIAKSGDIILIQTDCMALVNSIERRWSERSKKVKREKNLKGFKKAAAYTVKKIIDEKCELRIRHVKGHAPELGRRNYVNDICDQKARTAMQKHRELIKKNGVPETNQRDAASYPENKT